MKATRLTIKNIGLIQDAVIEFNQPLLLFYGEIRAGKTTLLNAVRWVFGGKFPTDIIRNGETEAFIRLGIGCPGLDGDSITRTFYRAQDGVTKARPIVFLKDGVAVKNPVAEIEKFLNPFLLDQGYLQNMSELERKKYFASMFAVDTAGLDAEIAATESKSTETRAKLKGYGEIDLTPVADPGDLVALQQTRAQILQQHQEAQAKIRGELAKDRFDHQLVVQSVSGSNARVRENNHQIDLAAAEAHQTVSSIARLEESLRIAREDLTRKNEWLSLNYRQQESPILAAPDTAALEQQLSQAADTAAIDAQLAKAQADKVRYDQFVKNQTRQQERQQDEASLLAMESATRELRSKKIAKLKEASASTGIVGLEFDESGNFSYEGCTAGMLSTSQIMRLSSQLSALYPEGFSIELLDRGESLGRSIFEFVKQAEAQQKTILATIVGERPAEVPEHIGVFVVEAGRVS